VYTYYTPIIPSFNPFYKIILANIPSEVLQDNETKQLNNF